MARVDEEESALAKEMREKKSDAKPASKIIQRSLAAVYVSVFFSLPLVRYHTGP